MRSGTRARPRARAARAIADQASRRPPDYPTSGRPEIAAAQRPGRDRLVERRELDREADLRGPALAEHLGDELGVQWAVELREHLGEAHVQLALGPLPGGHDARAARRGPSDREHPGAPP